MRRMERMERWDIWDVWDVWNVPPAPHTLSSRPFPCLRFSRDPLSGPARRELSLVKTPPVSSTSLAEMAKPICDQASKARARPQSGTTRQCCEIWFFLFLKFLSSSYINYPPPILMTPDPCWVYTSHVNIFLGGFFFADYCPVISSSKDVL